MLRFYPTLLLLLTAPLAHAQLSADYYYRAERPEPQVAVPPPDSATAQPARADSTRLLAPNDASATLLPTPAAPDTVTMPLSAYSPGVGATSWAAPMPGGSISRLKRYFGVRLALR